MNTDHTARLLAASRRVLSANQEAQPREYALAMSELEKIVASPLDTQPVKLETPRMETLLAALRELVRDMEENTTVGSEYGEHAELVFATRSRVVCHARTFENAKAAIQAATLK